MDKATNAAKNSPDCTTLNSPASFWPCRQPQAGPRIRLLVPWLVLDTALLLAGREPPRTHRWATTPEAAAEVSPGGRDARRFEDWQSLGLQIRESTVERRRTVEATASQAGNLSRLSSADVSLLALALDLDATLVTDDYTILDVAKRMSITTQTVQQEGVKGTLDWRPRCSGCGRWFDQPPPRNECPVCGSAVRAKPSS